MYPVYKKDTRNQSLKTSFPVTLNEAKNPVLVISKILNRVQNDTLVIAKNEAIHVSNPSLRFQITDTPSNILKQVQDDKNTLSKCRKNQEV